MHWKNTFILAFLFLFKKRSNVGGEHFLIVSTTGLGDTLWATPALRDLKQSFPNSHLYVLTTASGKETLCTNPHIEKCFVISDSLFSFILPFFALRKLRIGSALIFHASQRFALPFSSLLGIPRIIGTKGLNKGLDSLLTQALHASKEHEITRRQRLAAACGAKSSSRQLELPLSAAGREWVDSMLYRNTPPHSLFIGLHPGAKDRFKQYPPDLFAAVGRELGKRFNAYIVLTGSKNERALITSIQKQIPGALTFLEELSIQQLAALIARFSLFITNDTGPMHIACAVNTPTIALFSPTDPTLCGPLDARQSRTLYAPPTCTPCLKKRCRDGFCLRQILKEQVLNAAQELYAEQTVPHHNHSSHL